MTAKLVVLGCGFLGAAVARAELAAGATVRATTRDADRAAQLRARGIDARVAPALTDALVRELTADGARVLVAFPPDGATDARIAPALTHASALVYISSTAVYGATRGRIDAHTPAAPDEPRAHARLAAEGLYTARGAVALRAAGIYGPHRGLHVRLARGEFRLPGDGENVVSRIHVDDLATVARAAFARGPRGVAYPIADLSPVPQREAVAWLCARLGVAFPPAVAITDAPATLRHDRAVDSRAALHALGVTLAYPSYREGFAACLAAEAAGP